jgi:hypothetical protein
MTVQNHFGDASVVATVETMVAAPVELLGLSAANLTTSDAYLQLFDLAAADVTVGTTVPDLIFLVPAGNGTLAGAVDKDFPLGGVNFLTGISYAATTTPTGTTAPSTGLTLTGWYNS